MRRFQRPMMFLLLAGLMVAPGRATASAACPPTLRTAPQFFVEGARQGEAVGTLVTAVGDLDGDGRADYCTHTVNAGTLLTGVVHVYLSGSGNGATPSFSLEGTHVTNEFGDALAGVGDLNGDGYDDLVVGTTTPTVGSPEYWRMHVYLGRPNMTGAVDWIIDHTRDRPGTIGVSIAGIGDYNGDGFADFAVSTNSAGLAFPHGAEIHLGAATATGMARIQLMMDANEFGFSLAAVNDWDGDGLDDLAVGAPKGTGTVRIFGYPKRLIRTLTGTAQGDRFAHAIALVRGTTRAQDVLAVGAPLSGAGGGTSGLVELFSRSGQRLDAIVGTEQLEYGTALDASGDLNGDGLDDLIVGCPGGAFRWGEVHVYSGSSTGCRLVSWRASQLGSRYGASVALISGADGPLAKVAIGAPNHFTSVRTGGRLELHRVVRPRVRPLRAGHTVYAGERDTVRWSGAELVDLALSLDDGATWTTLQRNLGGVAENEIAWTVPSSPSVGARVRLSLSGEPAHAANSDATRAFRIAKRNAVSRVARREVPVASGHAASDREGTRLAWMADLDGDDEAEIVSGAPDAANGTGRVTLYLSRGCVMTWRGAAPGSRFGEAVVATHDLDGDGIADLAIGAPGAGVGGRVHVYRGGALMQPAPDWTLEGLQAGEEAGSALAVVSGLQYPGVASLAVGAPGMDGGAGGVRIYVTDPAFDGTPDLTMRGTQAGARFGATLADAGDLDSDGRNDLAVGAPLFNATAMNAGQVTVYRSPLGATPAVLVTLTGSQAFEGLGSALAGGGDLDADGYDDLVVGSPGRSGPHVDGGRVSVLHGGPRLDPAAATVIDGGASGARLGTAVAIAGDMNGDGVADLAAGAPLAGPADAGLVQVHYGQPRMSAVPDVATGGRPGDRLGLALAAAGDPRATRMHDLIVAAPFADGAAAADAGRIERIDMERYFLVRPNGGELWQAGTTQVVEWQGEEPAEVQLSLDGGLSYRPLADARVRTHVAIRVPVASSRHARVRVIPADRSVAGTDASDLEFEIRTAVRLVTFETEVKADGVHLEWASDPGPGPEGIRGYRLLRSPPGAPPEQATQVIEDVTTATRHVDPEGGPGVEYTLLALDATGQTLELGRVRVAGIEGLRLVPVPYRGAGVLRVAFEAPVDADGMSAADLSVRLYDAAGRQVAVLAAGPLEARARIVEFEWDGRRADGARTAPGVYFLRALAPSAGLRLTQRLVIVR
jgi:hypothetical protein